MCGRAVQSRAALMSATLLLNSAAGSSSTQEATSRHLQEDTTKNNNNASNSNEELMEYPGKDVWNMSPGMSSMIFRKPSLQHDKKTRSYFANEISTWGLVTRSGTKSSPIPDGASKHFSNLMFNARSETLYSKKVFSELALKGNTCIWAIDGFFEWKESEKNVISSQNKKKQPYFVHRKDGLPLLVAGLWTEVRTGLYTIDGEETYLHTFTALTKDSCSDLKWLHHRQPVFLWDVEIAKNWMEQPNEDLCQQLSSSNYSTNEKLVWHPVTKEMNKLSYSDANSIRPVKIEKVPSVKSFFTKTVKNNDTKNQCHSLKAVSMKVRHKKKPIDERKITSTPIIDLTDDITTKVSSKRKHLTIKSIIDGSDKRQKRNTLSNGKLPTNKVTMKGTITSFFNPKNKH